MGSLQRCASSIEPRPIRFYFILSSTSHWRFSVTCFLDMIDQQRREKDEMTSPSIDEDSPALNIEMKGSRALLIAYDNCEKVQFRRD
jgi:hypothetical protein